MSSEANLEPAKRPSDSTGIWESIALPPDLRQAVERAAASQGVDPVTWLGNAVARATAEATMAVPDGTQLSARDAEVARSLRRLLAAVRAREGEPTVVEPVMEKPARKPAPDPPALVRATAERAWVDRDPTSVPAPRPRRLLGALLMGGALTAAALAGIAVFYMVKRGSERQEAAISMALPRAPSARAPSAPTARGRPPASTTPSTAATSSAPSSSPSVATAPSTPSSGTTAAVPTGDAERTPPSVASTAPSGATSASPGSAGTPETGAGAAPVDPLAAFRLGVRYAFGDGVAQDYQKAAEQFRIAADQGLPDAQYNLAALYDHGLGVPRDPVRAVIWYHSAAEQGHPSAELNLGLAYANGSGVAQDYGEAARWFRRAAAQGVVTAQYNLAALYANGNGVGQSMIDAYAWFSIAAGSGDTEAQHQMQRAGATLNAKQLRDAKALAISLGQQIDHPGEPQPDTTPPSGSAETPTKPPASENAPSGTATSTAVVAEIQRYLIRLHYDPGRADGEMNGKTSDAIRKYQTDRNIKVDGEPTRALLFRLKAEIQQQAKQ